MDIYDSISEKKLNEELIDIEINVKYLEDILHKKDLDDISSYLNKYILENKNIENTKKLVVYPLLSIKSDNKQILEIYEFLSLFYHLEQKEKLDINNKIKIPIDLWTHVLNFWFNEHPKEIESYVNIKGFQNKMLNKNLDAIGILKWMNNYLAFLKINSRNRNFEKLKIFPNQNGIFCFLNSLHYDSGFPEEFKDILKNYFNIDKKEILLAKEIVAYNSYQIMPEIDITKQIESEFNKLKMNNKNSDKLKDIAFEIICLYPKNDEKAKIREYIEQIIYPLNRTHQQLSQFPIEYSGFSEIIFNKPEIYKYKFINTKNLDYLVFINYIIGILCEKLNKENDYENIKNNFFGIKTIKDLELLLTKMIKFQWENADNDFPIKNYIDYNSNKKIFLNMKNKLIPMKDLKIKEGFDLDKNDENIILDMCLNKHVNKDFRNELINENLGNNLSKYKDRFRSYTLKSICNEVDQAIMKCDQNNSNQDGAYDSDFLQIIEDMKKINCSQEKLKELFPYYWKNKSRISISCLDENSADKLMSLIKFNRVDKQLKILEAFSKPDAAEKLSEYLELCGGDPYSLLNRFNNFYIFGPTNINLIIAQHFKFKMKFIDENKKETIIEKPLNLPLESLNFPNNYADFKNNIEFEIKQIIKPDSKEKEIEIKYSKI